MGFKNTLLIPESSKVTPDILDSVATKDLILTVFLIAPFRLGSLSVRSTLHFDHSYKIL